MFAVFTREVLVQPNYCNQQQTTLGVTQLDPIAISPEYVATSAAVFEVYGHRQDGVVFLLVLWRCSGG